MLGITKDQVKNSLGPLSPVVDAWLKFVDGFTWVLTRVVLISTFFTVFLAYGVVLRVIRKDPMNRTLEECDSYWDDNIVNNKSIDDFSNLY